MKTRLNLFHPRYLRHSTGKYHFWIDQTARGYNIEYTDSDQEKQVLDPDQNIVRDPSICGGEPVIRGTRVPLRTILASLAEGDTPEQILRDYPTLTEHDLRSVIRFAAASAQEDLPAPGIPSWK